MKKLFTVLFFLPFAFLSAMAQTSGTTPNGIVWNFKDGVLTLSGGSKIADIAESTDDEDDEDEDEDTLTDEEKAELLKGDTPWMAFADEISKIVVEKEINYIGNNSFLSCSETELTIKGSKVTIGTNAFLGNGKLENVNVEGSISSIGAQGFEADTMLRNIYFNQSEAPSIETSTFSLTHTDSIKVFIPCGATDAYQSAPVWAGYKDSTAYNIYAALMEMFGTSMDDIDEAEKAKLIQNVKFNFNEQASTFKLTIDEVDGATITKTETGCAVYELTCTVDKGYNFVSWTDGVTDITRTIKLTADSTLGVIIESTGTEAPIVKDSVTLYAQAAYYLIGSCEPSYGRYAVGDTVTVTAIPADGYIFDSWWDGTYNKVYTFVITKDTSLTAAFRRCDLSADSVNVYAVSKVSTQGKVVGGGDYKKGDTVTVIATAYKGSVFSHWSNGATTDTLTFVANDHTTLVAYFDYYVPKDSVTLYAQAAYYLIGSCEPSYGRYAVGDTVTVTAIPADGYIFDSWWDGTYNKVYTFVITKDTSLTAAFRRCDLSADSVNVYAVSKVSPEGKVVGGGDYKKGDTVTVIATPYEGYAFSHWNTGATTDTLTFVANDHTTLVAYFKLATGIENVAAEDELVNVYNIKGILQKRNVKREDALYDLPRGIYIVGHKKVLKVER